MKRNTVSFNKELTGKISILSKCGISINHDNTGLCGILNRLMS